MLSYQEFKDTIRTHILEYMPNSQDSSVTINEVRKNNGITLDGLMVRKPEERISPTVYLESYYDDYKKGMSVENCMHKIAVTIDSAKEQARIFDVEHLLNYEDMKSKIYISVVNFHNNQELLSQVPFDHKGDLAIVVRALASQNPNENASFLIKNDMLEKYGISREQLFADAYSNSPVLMPSSFTSMRDVLQEMIHENLEDLMPEDVQMYVLTNEQKIRGASTMFYPGVMDMIHEKLGDFTIIPSSIHEVIIVPADTANSRVMEAMIGEVNTTCVDAQEILADKPLTYDSVAKEILNLEEYEKYVDGIKKDIVKSGFKATNRLVMDMRKINHVTGEDQGISGLNRLSKELGKIEDQDLLEAVKDATAECRMQELARLNQPLP